MTEVKFSEYQFRTDERNGRRSVFDIARKKWVILTPEEWVRQHVLHYLIIDKNYPVTHIAVERGIELNGLRKRFDLVIFSVSGKPAMIIECKAPEEPLNEKVFEQIARYNLSLNVKYLWVTNGKSNYCCKLVKGIELLSIVPDYDEIKKDEL